MSEVMEFRESLANYLSVLKPPLVQHFESMATAPGGVGRLRKLILTLAVQGRLVPQDPSDEPASELLQKIRIEKDRLIADGKIKRDKALPEIEIDEVPFLTPKTWEWVRLGDVSSYIQRGKSPTYADSSAHRVISQKCVRWYGLDIDPARYITEDSLSKYEEIRFLQAGDLLWNSTGTGTIGRACLVDAPHADSRLVADSHVTVVRPIQLISSFLWRWVQCPYVQDEIEGSASGTTNQIELNTSTVIRHLMPLPPLAEQSRIVSRVEELMHLCDALDAKGRLEAAQHIRLAKTLLGALTASISPEELADNWQRVATHFDLLLDRPEAVDALEQTILQLAVRGLIVPQDPNDQPASVLLQKIRAEKECLIAEGKIKGDKTLPSIAEEEQPFVLPYGWAWARLQQAYDVRDGTHDTPKYQSTGYPLVTSKNIYGGVLDLSDVKLISPTDHQQISARSKVDRNDILFAMIGSIGNPVLVDTDVEFSVKNVALFKYYGASLSCPQYLLLVLQTEAVGMKARAAGGVQSFIALGQLRSTVVALPPLAEQFRIVARVESLRRLCADLRQRLTTRQTTQAQLAEALIDEVA